MAYVAEISGEAERASLARPDLAELYRRHAPDALRLAYLLTGDRAEAEDVTHDAFVRVAGRLRSIREPDAFAGYLRRTIVNEVAAHTRRRGRERARVERVARMNATSGSGVADADVDGPLWQALQALPERQRTAIVLRHWLDLSEAQTAELLRCPLGTVKSLLSRGLTTMRGAIAHD